VSQLVRSDPQLVAGSGAQASRCDCAVQAAPDSGCADAGTAQGEQEVGRSPISRVGQATLASADGGPGVQGRQRRLVEWDDAFGVEFAERHFEPAAVSGKVPEAVQFEVE
jgi:hypothetical protein